MFSIYLFACSFICTSVDVDVCVCVCVCAAERVYSLFAFAFFFLGAKENYEMWWEINSCALS